MTTQRARHEAGECHFDTCAFCWQEHEALLAAWAMEVDVREELPVYTNGDRAEDTEAGIVRPSDAAFYTDENGG